MKAAPSLFAAIGLAVLALALALCVPGSAARAGEVLPKAGLSGTLERVARSGTIVLGYRESSFPFSFAVPGAAPRGYSIELCLAVAEEIGHSLGRDNLRVEYAKVTSETRLAAVVAGKVDLECGSTTANGERARLVSFSPMIFVAGTMVMVPKGTPWSDFRSLKGKRVAVTAGTTNGQALRRLDERFGLGITLVEGADHDASYANLASGKVDALASDNILLAGMLAQYRARDRFAVVGEMLSYDPYGLVYAKGDLALREIIERTFRRLVREHEFQAIYGRWFSQKLPNGERFQIPMSPQLEEAFKVLARDLEPEGN